MGKSTKAVNKQAVKTQRRVERKPFSPQALNFLITNAGKLRASSIAKRLKRTVKSVRRKAEKLSLSLRVGN